MQSTKKVAAPASAVELALSPLAVLLDGIPQELRGQPNWIVWRLEPPSKAGEAPRKMPYQPATGKPAKSNAPATWADFDAAIAAYTARRGRAAYSGIGYVFAQGGGLVGIDLDDCRAPETGELTPWAVEIVERFATYAEVSPSGTGVKLWCRGKLPIETTGKKEAYEGGAVELYQHGRYFAATGHKLPDVPGTVSEAQVAIDWLWAKVFGAAKPKVSKGTGRRNGRNGTRPQDQQRTLERARKYIAKMPPAISGQRGHDATFAAACVLVVDFALSVGEAYPLLVEYSERCEPPWTDQELLHKLKSANEKPGERGRLLHASKDLPPQATSTVAVDGAGEAELLVGVVPQGSKVKREVTAKLGDARHTDRIDVSCATSRKRFVKELAGKASIAPDAVAAVVDGKLVELAAQADDAQRAEQGKPAFDDDAAERYTISDAGCICSIRQTDDGEQVIPLCNFSARIIEEVTRDDGAEQNTLLTIDGALAGGQPLPPASVKAEEFPLLNWTFKAWGTRPTIRAGAGAKDKLREAIQLLSENVTRRTVYAQTGWREIAGEWHYLHAAGAINAAGLTTDVATDLPDSLARFVLPEPPSGDELRRAILASLALLDLADERITATVIAAVYRAPLGDTNFSLHVCGPTGARKSTLAALAQQHYGSEHDNEHLPANWQSTANAVEGIAFAAADGILTIDDFAPGGNFADQARYHKDADRVFRSAGNRAGRGRMRADGSLRPTKPPRALMFSTGEDLPRGHSVRARLLAIEIGKDDLAFERLSPLQRDARDGLYAAAMAGYLKWLAPQYGGLRDRLSAEMVELRDALPRGDCHARTPGIVAELTLGWRYLLRFAVEAGAIDENLAAELMYRACAGLLTAAQGQATHQQDAEPAQHFGRLLVGVLASGRGHLASVDGDAPDNPGGWGWREITVGGGVNARRDWQPQGQRIGWVDCEGLYLQPEAAYAAAQKLAGEQGDALAVRQQTLWRRLHERHYLASVDDARETLKVRKTIDGERRQVLHVSERLLSADESTDAPPERDTDAAAALAARAWGWRFLLNGAHGRERGEV